MKNYYEILKIQSTAKNDEIKTAYRRAALFWHPDKNKIDIAHEKFIEVNEAYNILIDVGKRKVYDHLFDNFFKMGNGITSYGGTKKEYQTYEQWVKFERVKAEKLVTISSDEILTDTFHFIDKYGWIIFFCIMGLSILFFISIGVIKV